ncbi:MAG: putative phosphothreonine lyase domain-containing protein [Vulcanimicrobiaceae bacterium]
MLLPLLQGRTDDDEWDGRSSLPSPFPSRCNNRRGPHRSLRQGHSDASCSYGSIGLQVSDRLHEDQDATKDSLLGSSAKVATMKPNPNAASHLTRLICVYTYDVDDEGDCLRVRQVLRDLRVTWKIPYKADADTHAGRYSRNGVRVSKRYE